eukprot:1137765-Pelagomonas_calceolata.AAC.1
MPATDSVRHVTGNTEHRAWLSGEKTSHACASPLHVLLAADSAVCNWRTVLSTQRCVPQRNASVMLQVW